MLHTIAAGFRVLPYSLLSGNLSKVNYSSGKIGLETYTSGQLMNFNGRSSFRCCFNPYGIGFAMRRISLARSNNAGCASRDGRLHDFPSADEAKGGWGVGAEGGVVRLAWRVGATQVAIAAPPSRRRVSLAPPAGSRLASLLRKSSPLSPLPYRRNRASTASATRSASARRSRGAASWPVRSQSANAVTRPARCNSATPAVMRVLALF